MSSSQNFYKESSSRGMSLGLHINRSDRAARISLGAHCLCGFYRSFQLGVIQDVLGAQGFALLRCST